MIFAQIALSTYSSLENKQQLAYIYRKLKWFTKVESQITKMKAQVSLMTTIKGTYNLFLKNKNLSSRLIVCNG